jgi:hypothetical protein
MADALSVIKTEAGSQLVPIELNIENKQIMAVECLSAGQEPIAV